MSEKVFLMVSAEKPPSVELLTQQYSLVEEAIRTKLVTTFLTISDEVMPIVTELAAMIDKSLKAMDSSPIFREALEKSASTRELVVEMEKLMLCYHRIIVGHEWNSQSINRVK